MTGIGMEAARKLADRVERFVRDEVIPYENDPRRSDSGPHDELVQELREKARAAGVLTPHVQTDGTHLTQRETAAVIKKSGLSPLGPLACNTAAPDEGNIFLLGKVATEVQRERFLAPLLSGKERSAFFMTEPAEDNGAGSDPSMMRTTAHLEGDEWIINGRKQFITGALGAKVGIVMAKSDEGATMFLVDLPNSAIHIDRLIPTIDNSMPGGHSSVTITNLHVPRAHVLGAVGEAFKYAQVRLSPARLSHCMRWFGLCTRANEIATAYACRRQAFGKLLVDHEGVGFMLADNLIDLKTTELLIDWAAEAIDAGDLAVAESSMAKVAASEALFRVADRCVQVMGGTGVSGDTIVEATFREIRAFRIYDGPTEVHKWSLAKRVKREYLANEKTG